MPVPTVTTRQLLRYLGSRYKTAHRLAHMFGDKCGKAPRSELQNHYLDVSISYANQAATYQEIIQHLKNGDMATWQ